MSDPMKPILSLEVPIIVRIAEEALDFEDILKWVPGAIVELGKDADELLDLLVNNVAIGQGSAVKVGENFGIRITYIGDLKTKIEAMGGSLTIGEESPSPSEDDDAEDLAAKMLAGQL